MAVYVPGSAKRSPEGVTNRISAPFRLNVGLISLACDRFDIVEHVLEVADDRMGFKAQMVALHVAVRNRSCDPLDVQAEQIEKFTTDDRDLGLVDSVGAENRAAAALSALEEVIPPFFQYIEGQFTGACHLAEDLAGQGELFSIDRPDQFGPEHRHILGIAGADKEVALIRAGAAAYADVHEEPERPVLFQALRDPFEEDLLPVLGQFPVRVGRSPVPRVRETDDVQAFRLRSMAEHALFDHRGRVHPPRFRRSVIYL